MSKKTFPQGQPIVRNKDGWSVSHRSDSTPHRGVQKDYGKGLPPPGPSNYIVTTPNFLPFESEDGSKKSK